MPGVIEPDLRGPDDGASRVPSPGPRINDLEALHEAGTVSEVF